MNVHGFTPLFNQPPGAAGADSLKTCMRVAPKTGFQPCHPIGYGPGYYSPATVRGSTRITVKKDKDRVAELRALRLRPGRRIGMSVLTNRPFRFHGTVCRD